MKAKDVDMNIVFKWLSKQEDTHWNKVTAINLYPGSNSYFEICELITIGEGGYSGKAITFDGENETGVTCRYTIPILEYTQILREEKLNKIL
jgi:hypothetical protein